MVRADELLRRCQFPSAGSHIDCAVSGGPDSLALLVLAVESGCDVVAWHVDHGLRPGSDKEAQVVADAAARFGARFEALQAHVDPGPNLEARARGARRAVLPAGFATGHTADDQAETVLLNMLRGAGGDGLTGMAHGPAHPLLDLRRDETRSLVLELGLVPVEDPSNLDPAHLRNRIRHELIPLASELARRDIVPILARQARLLAGDAAELDALTPDLAGRSGGGGDAGGVPVSSLTGLGEPIARRAVRNFLRAGDECYPPTLAAVERVLAVARGEATACDIEGGRHVRRSHGRLFIEPAGGSSSGHRPADVQ